MTRRRGDLTDEDRLLWRHVVRHVRPLDGRGRAEDAEPGTHTAPPPAIEPEAPPRPAAKPLPAATAAPYRPKPPAPPPIPPLSPLERRERIALKRGRRAPDATIDLHGLRQAEAHLALLAFVRRAQERGHALVLVVTGKGGAEDADPFGGRGVLRRSVPRWLGEPDLRGIVVGFETAAPQHGGEGALYVRLRRRGA